MKLFIIALAFVFSNPETCLQLPEQVSVEAKTKKGSLDKYGSGSVTINQLSDSQFEISDFSAGYFDQFGQSSPSITITINCSEVESQSIDTDFGTCQITGGLWNSNNGKLTISWEIPFNDVYEVSEFKIK
ncbi:MAG: hypothetical protein NXI20_28075 [bacterium]|nr:hypothetical protein [bacterium]